MTDQRFMDWHIIPSFLLRRAGFPFGLLESLADAEVIAAAQRYRAAVVETEKLREILLRSAIPQAVSELRARDNRQALRRLSALRTAVGRRRPFLHWEPAAGWSDCLRSLVTDLARAHAEARSATTALQAGLAAELLEQPRKIAAIFSEDPVLDAVLQLSPNVYDAVQRHAAAGWSGRGRDRAFARRMYLYCQRLAAKNETTSFFGPLTHGVVDPSRSSITCGPEGPLDPADGRVFLAFWATVALARAMAAHPAVRPRVPVTWVPVCVRLPGLIELGDERQVTVDDEMAKVLDAVDGTRGAQAISAAAGVPAARVDQLLTRLVKLGVVRDWPEPASAVLEPFGQLIEDADRYATDTSWPAKLRELRKLVHEYGSARNPEQRRTALAAAETMFEGLAGVPARRAAGRMYADRAIAYLESAGDLTPLVMGGDVAGLIERELAPVLDLAAHYGELRHQATRQLAWSVFAEAKQEQLPYRVFIHLMRDAVRAGRSASYEQPAERFSMALATLVRQHTDGRIARLAAEDVRSVGLPAQGARFVSPDILLVGDPDGRLRLVLGELHPYVFAWGSQSLFCDDPVRLQKAFADVLESSGHGELATVIRRRRHKGLVSEEFPGHFVEVTAVASRDRTRSISVTDLIVEADGGRLRLCGPNGELTLYAGEDDHAHLLAFAPPPVQLPLIRLGDRAPRIEIGRVVAQRARWWLDPAELTSSGRNGEDTVEPRMASFLALQRLRARLGLPRWVFAHVAGEPKPICFDLDCPLAAETLCALAANASDGEVALAEMLPAPRDLWLRRCGAPMTSELRLAFTGALP